jgi:hypothetical protein
VVEASGLSSKAMTPDPSRTDASSRDRSPDHQYTLSIEQTAELYAKAGHPRTIRAIQKYCALNKLDCHKVETETGEKYLVTPSSVERHIAYIEEVQPVATGRDHTRTDASVRPFENKELAAPSSSANDHEQTRPDATIRAADDRYVQRVESENEFLRGQIGAKDRTIEALLERDRETNHLIAGLQKILSPALDKPKGNSDSAG